MLAWIVVFLLEALHIDPRSEFQWTHAAHPIVCLVECLRVHGTLPEHFHFVGARASNLLPCRADLDLRGRFGQLNGVFLCILLWWRLLYWFSRPSLLGPLSDNHFGKRFLWGNCLQKLFFVDLLVSVEVNPSNYGVVILLTSLLSSCIEEALKVLLVDVVQTAIIHSLIRCSLTVTFGRLKLLFQFFCVTVHLNFHDYELG